MYQKVGKLVGVLYIENNILPDVMTSKGTRTVAVSNQSRSLYDLEIFFDGVGYSAKVLFVLPFPEECEWVRSVCVSGNDLFLAARQGIWKVSKNKCSLIVASENVNGVDMLGESLIFTDSALHQILMYNCEGENIVLSGSGKEGNRDGIASSAMFCQPMGLCVQNSENIFVTDSHAGTVKLLTNVHPIATFLQQLGALYKSYRVHCKGQKADKSNLSHAINNLNEISDFLHETEEKVKSITGFNGITNGPQGTISNKTLKSVDLLRDGLSRLKANIATITGGSDISENFNTVSLLSTNVEHIHATTHFKVITPSMLEHAMFLAAIIDESMKRITKWSAYYYTHKTTYYPVPDTQIKFKDLPKLKKIKVRKMRNDDMQVMRDWAREYGKCVRQRTVRQETTKHKMGTLPLNMYQSLDIEHAHGTKVVFEDTEVAVVDNPESDTIHASTVDSPITQRLDLSKDYNELQDEYYSFSDDSDVDFDLEVNFLLSPVYTRSGRRVKIRQQESHFLF